MYNYLLYYLLMNSIKIQYLITHLIFLTFLFVLHHISLYVVSLIIGLLILLYFNDIHYDL